MIIGRGHEGAGAGGRGHLRASDIDRELTVDALKAAFMQGRLTQDELAERVGRALAARTYAGLDSLTADIPRDLAAPQSRSTSARIEASTRANSTLHDGSVRDRAISATALLAALTVVIAYVLNDGAVSALLALSAIASGFVSMMLLTAHLRAARRDARDGGAGARRLNTRRALPD